MSDNSLLENKEYFLKIVHWLKQVHGSDVSFRLPPLPKLLVVNSENSTPTVLELAIDIEWMINRAEHPSYISVYHADGGWQTALCIWNSVGYPGYTCGFYEPFNTGMGPYGHTKKGYNKACKEAVSWAKDESITDIRIPPYTR